MQAVKDKLSDMSTMRKIKAETKAEEKAEREFAKARADVAHEVRLAKEAEAEMLLHVNKAQQKAEREMEKHAPRQGEEGADPHAAHDCHGHRTANYGTGDTGTDDQYPNDIGAASNFATSNTTGTGYPTTQNTTGAPPSNQQFL